MYVLVVFYTSFTCCFKVIFHKHTVLRWSFTILCGGGGGGGGLVTYICKTYLCTPRKLFRGAKNEGARDAWEFQRFPSRLLPSIALNEYLSLRINIQ